MGSTYHGPNSDCYNCRGCGTNRACDDCSANCCQNNMSSHRQLRNYENCFGSEVNNLCRLTVKKCIKIIKGLETSHGIYIYHKYYDYDFINQSNELISKMKTKKDDIKKEASSINIDYFFERKIDNLKYDHQRRMNEIKEDFNEKIGKIKDDPELKKLNQEIIGIKDEKNKLNNEKKNCENYKEIDYFSSEQTQRLNKIFNERKRDIDLKYSELGNIKEPIMEYSIEEKNSKKYLLNCIKRIQNYKNFPNFTNIINKFKLDYYLLQD